jgi:hypothetical protein
MSTVAQVVSQETGEDKDETGWLCVIPSATAGTYTITVTASNTTTDYAFAFYEFPIGTYTYDVGSTTTTGNTDTIGLPVGDDYYIYAYSAGNGIVTATTLPLPLDADSEVMGGATVSHDTAETETFSATGDLVMCGIGIKRTDAVFVAPTVVGQTAQGVISTTFTFTVANTGSFVVLGLAVGYWAAVSVECPFPTCTRIGEGFPVGLPFQGEYSFYANGLYWTFYTDGIGNDLGWKYSKDTTIWSAYNLLSPTSYQFALTVVGSKIYYARIDSVSGRCYFNYGPMGIDGSIVWTGEIDTGAPIWCNYPSIAIDDSGNAYITVNNGTIYVYTNRTGPWTLDLTLIAAGNIFQRILALTSGKMVLVYDLNFSDNLHIERFNGAAWSAGSSTSGAHYLMYSGLVAIGDVVYGATAAYETYNSTYDYTTDTWTETVALDTQVANIVSNSSNRLVMSYWGVNAVDYINSTDLGSTWSPLATVDTVTNPVWVTPVLTDTNNLSFVFRSTFANPSGYWVNNPSITFPATTNLSAGTDLTLAITSASGVIAPVSVGTDTTLAITSASGVITPIPTGMDFTLTASVSGATTSESAEIDTTLSITSASGVVAPVSAETDTTLTITSASGVIAQPMPVGAGFALTATLPSSLYAEASATTTVTTQDISKPLTAGIGATTTVTTQDITNSLAAGMGFTLTTSVSGVSSSESAGIGATTTAKVSHQTTKALATGIGFALTTTPDNILPTDFGVGQEEISIQRIYPSMPASGAYPMTPMEADYMATTYQQMIDTIGMSITYKIAKIDSLDQYEHPVYSYTDLTINAVVANMDEKEYDYVEVGFLPAHYSKLWVYQVTPEVGDRLLWMDILWEVRAGIPRVIANTVLYYDIIIRRVLSEGSLVSGGTLTTGGEGTLTTGGGGTSNPPDPNDP